MTADIKINRDKPVDLALALCQIEGPAGHEAEVGEYVVNGMTRKGFKPSKIGMIPEHFNVLGRLPSEGDGLIFNSHLDSGRSKEDRWSITCTRRPFKTIHLRRSCVKSNLQGFRYSADFIIARSAF
jgi:acetylornithine deacetylase/succinyl-diaminopimelate desuccinylase-like protein